MATLDPLIQLAREMGVATYFTDGLDRPVTVGRETLVRICAALGAPISNDGEAGSALEAVRARAAAEIIPPVVVAWDGIMPAVPVRDGPADAFTLTLEDGTEAPTEALGPDIRSVEPLPNGYHTLTVSAHGQELTCTVISAPVRAWQRPGEPRRSWGVGTQLAALRSSRSRSLADLRDLETVCRWVGQHGGDVVTVLPLLPSFNQEHPEPSPYSPVTRLFWSELMLDLGEAHKPVGPVDGLDVTAADNEVRDALADVPAPDPASVPGEILNYARYRGAQKKLGRNWRDWPEPACSGELLDEHVDAEEARYHLVAQLQVRKQLGELLERLGDTDVRIGLDLAVGVHPDGYDAWSRQDIFAPGVSVGAPPDGGFPSGQDWGFHPVHPGLSRREGHRYIAASIAHQAELCGVLRVDHVMAWTRLYWIPHGLPLSQGTYVSYPADELFAILTLESHRHECEVVGENLGTVPPEIDDGLPLHNIWGMFLAQFEASEEHPSPPGEQDVALIGTHDTPTFTGWITGVDIGERIRCELLDPSKEPDERNDRHRATRHLAHTLGANPDDHRQYLANVLDWLGRSPSPLVVPWIEDLWLEVEGVNLPGTPSWVRPNFQRAMGRLIDEALIDPRVVALAQLLNRARTSE